MDKQQGCTCKKNIIHCLSYMQMSLDVLCCYWLTPAAPIGRYPAELLSLEPGSASGSRVIARLALGVGLKLFGFDDLLSFSFVQEFTYQDN